MKHLKKYNEDWFNESTTNFMKKYGSQQIFDLVSDYVSDHADNLKTHKVTSTSIDEFLSDSGVKLSSDDKAKFTDVLNKESESW